MNFCVGNITPKLSSFFRMAIIAGVESAVRIHIERGDNLNARDAGGQTPLMLAAARSKPHIFKLLLDAGADPHLTDSDGNNALFIANAAGAQEIASLLEPAFANALSFPVDEVPANVNLICSAESGQTETLSQPGVPEATATVSPPEVFNSNAALEISARDHSADIRWPTALASTPVDLIDFDEDGATLDLSGWEAEADISTPNGDPDVLTNASDVQKAISDHAPIDISADWDDIDAFLPERASPLPRADDAEARERLRSLLLRATREGSVPNETIEDLTINDDQTPNTEAAALLRMVVNDLGAEADERHEYSTHHESFAVHVEPRETPEEEQTVDDALAFIEDLESRRNDPLRLYQRDFSNGALLTADEEVAISKAMEHGVETALDALASSITGIEAVVEASQLVKSKMKPLRWLSSGKRKVIPGAEAELGKSNPTKVDSSDDDTEVDKGSQDESEDGSLDDELSEFISKAEHLWSLARSLESQPNPLSNRMRDALGSLGLSGSYLLDLSESGCIKELEYARALRSAMQTYRAARDRMALANLKLVYAIAKKYLYSGIPLDDLLQEGNIGLLKGVERFNWRRGFKFSTYATWWIRQQVSRFVADRARTIRLPVHVHEKVQRIRQVARAFEIDHGRSPGTAEIAELVDLSSRKVAAYMQIAGEPLPIHELDIDSMIATDARGQYISPDPMDIVSDHDLTKVAHKILRTLKRKEEIILRMRFGIGMHEVMTLDEIGTRVGLTRERIRQIESKVIRDLKLSGSLEGLLKKLNGTNPTRHPRDDDHEEIVEPYDTTEEVKVRKLVETVAIKQQLTNARKPPIAPVNYSVIYFYRSELETSASFVPSSIQMLILEATVLGASLKFDQQGVNNSIWIDFNKVRTAPPPPLILKMIDSGFKCWSEEGD